MLTRHGSVTAIRRLAAPGGAGALPVDPYLLRVAEGGNLDLVAPCESCSGLRVSVVRGEGPLPRPAPCRRAGSGLAVEDEQEADQRERDGPDPARDRALVGRQPQL